MATPKEPPAADVSTAGGGGPSASDAGPDLARILPFAGLGVALWASLPQYSGPKLYVEASKEVADHIVPAVFVLVASLAAIWATRRAQGPGALRFMAGLVVLLAGLWMMATHLPLVLQTIRGGPEAASWAATIYHFSSALAVFGLGLLWAAVTWSEAGEESEPATQAHE